MYSCEPANICSYTGLTPFSGVNFTCCSGSDNCNVDSSLTIPTQNPNLPPAPPILCYEGVFLNKKPVNGRDDPVVCRGQCASLGIKLGSIDYTVYTCDPAALCESMQISNNCQEPFNGTFTGCCCNCKFFLEQNSFN